MTQSNKDPNFEDLMAKSRMKMPFSNFEDDVITQIKKQKEHQKVLKRDIQLSWISFISGIICGIIVTIQLLEVRIGTFGMGGRNIELISYFIFSVFVIFSLDQLIKLSKKVPFKELLSLDK